MKKIFKFGLVFLVLILVYNLLLFLSSLIPSQYLETKARESSETFLKQRNTFYVLDFYYVINDNYTDSLMINESVSIDSANPVYSYMAARKNYKTGLTIEQIAAPTGELKSITSRPDGVYDTTLELSEFLAGKVTTSIEYARYWHGYLVALRPLLVFFNVTQIRIILLIVLIALLIPFTLLIKKRFGLLTAFIFAFSLFTIDYLFVSFSLQGAPLFIVMMISSIILLLRLDKIKNFYLYLFVVASISNFVDYLTVPLVTLGVPLLIYLLHLQKTDSEKTNKEFLKVIFLSCISWGFGYGLTWISKWIIYDIIFHKHCLTTALNQILYRSTGTPQIYSKKFSAVIIQFLLSNIMYVGIFCIQIIAYTVFRFVLKGTRSISLNTNQISPRAKKGIPYLLVSLLPLLWYFVVQNHSSIHIYFTYRHMLIFVLGILLFLKTVFCPSSDANNK